MKIRVCRRCGMVVKKSQVKGYPWYCPMHDEDLYGFEIDVIEFPRKKPSPTGIQSKNKEVSVNTAAGIGLTMPDGTISAIHLHCDGEPTKAGAILLQHYTTFERVKALVELGYIYFLGAKLGPNLATPHTWSQPQPGVTIAYGRERGFPPDEALEFRNRMEYAVEADDLLLSDELYLFENGRWLVFDYPHCTWRELSEVLKNT